MHASNVTFVFCVKVHYMYVIQLYSVEIMIYI